MSQKTGRKIGFFSALTMLVGSVVGIGIFFKSHGILRANDWNGTGTFLAWLLGGILSLSAAVSFSEMSSMKTGSVHGLSGWAEKVGGVKFGYFIRFNYSFFYFGLLTLVLGVFGSEMIFNMISSMSDNYEMSDFPVYAHIILGAAFSIFFLIMNFFSVRTSGIIASATTILKWIPLALVAILGVLFATTNNNPSNVVGHPLKDVYPNLGQSAFTNGQSFTFVGMLGALPAVLFAFDAFLGVGNLRNKMEEPKRLPSVVIVGMVSVLILYLIIALSAIFHGSGMVSGLPMGAPAVDGLGIFDQILDNGQALIMGKFISVFIAISTFGVINGLSAAAIAAHEQAIEVNTFFGIKSLKRKFSFKTIVIGYAVSVSIFWTLIFGIPASVLNSDSMVDGISNFPTLFFFAMYGTVILMYTLKRKEIETTRMNDVVFKIFAWTAIIGIAFVVGYQLLYGFLIDAILHPAKTTHWGLYAGDSGTADLAFPGRYDVKGGIGVGMTLAQSSILLFSMISIFASFPFLNQFLTSRFEGNDVIIDTFKFSETKIKE